MVYCENEVVRTTRSIGHLGSQPPFAAACMNVYFRQIQPLASLLSSDRLADEADPEN